MTSRGPIFLFLALCSAGCIQPDQPVAAQNSTQTASLKPATTTRNCLSRVWQARPSPNQNFDRQFDRHGSDSFSCDAYTSASAVQQSLTNLRDAAHHRDVSGIARQLHYPFRFIDRRGRGSLIRSRAAFESQARAILTPDVYAALGRMTLSSAHLIPTQGIFFELGGLWLVNEGVGQVPRLATINHRALSIAREPVGNR